MRLFSVYSKVVIASFLRLRIQNKFSNLRSGHQDYDSSGRIRLEVIEVRFRFLKAHHLLEDYVKYILNAREQEIFANRHLYNIFEHVNEKGHAIRFNIDRMQQGYALKCFRGASLEIHHIRQTHSDEWSVLTRIFHTRYNRMLHSPFKPTEGVNRNRFRYERKFFWQSEAKLALESLSVCGNLSKENNKDMRHS